MKVEMTLNCRPGLVRVRRTPRREVNAFQFQNRNRVSVPIPVTSKFTSANPALFAIERSIRSAVPFGLTHANPSLQLCAMIVVPESNLATKGRISIWIPSPPDHVLLLLPPPRSVAIAPLQTAGSAAELLAAARVFGTSAAAKKTA